MGYYLALVGCKKPWRRLLDSVLLPAGAGLAANLIVAFFRFRAVGEPAYFVSQLPGVPHLWEPRILQSLAVSLGPGFQFASIGFVLVAAFFVLYSWGRATLPMRLPAASLRDVSVPEDEHAQTMFFVWMMVAMVFLAHLPGIALTVFSDWIVPIAPRFFGPENWFPLRLIDSCVQLVIVVLAVGKSGRKMIPGMLQSPRAIYLAVAILVPSAIASVGPLASYFHARLLWSAPGWGKDLPPSPRNFFELAGVASLWYFVPALVEEIAWRGYLQPRFIRRYGLVRGIFLVGVVWGAFHYAWDFNTRMTSLDVVVALASRLVGTICLSYVLAWLTIRAESVLPAAIAHGIYNIFVTSRTLPTANPLWLTRLLWAVAGCALFYFFPPPSPASVEVAETQSVSATEPSKILGEEPDTPLG